MRVDGQVCDLAEDIDLDKNKKHTIEVVVDRLVTGARPDGRAPRSRIADSVETALKLGSGIVRCHRFCREVARRPRSCSSRSTSPASTAASAWARFAPRTFSFNSPHGACPTCTGLGTKMEIDPDLVIPNKNLSLAEGAIQPWARASTVASWYYRMLERRGPPARLLHSDVPVQRAQARGPSACSSTAPQANGHPARTRTSSAGLQHYDTTYEGVIPNLERRYRETESDYIRGEIERYMTAKPCPACEGKRLKPEAWR